MKVRQKQTKQIEQRKSSLSSLSHLTSTNVAWLKGFEASKFSFTQFYSLYHRRDNPRYGYTQVPQCYQNNCEMLPLSLGLATTRQRLYDGIVYKI